MQTILVTGGTEHVRARYIQSHCEKLKIHPIDQYILTSEENASIGIEEVRNAQKQLSLRPLSGITKMLWIKNASLLTIESQHALLKTLEEPPPHTLIILDTQSEEALLPTILSRSHIVTLALTPQSPTNQQKNEYLSLWKNLVHADPVARLTLIPQLSKDRSSYQEFVNTQILFLHLLLQQNLREEKGTQDFSLGILHRLMTGLLTTQNHLDHNLTPSVALDQFLLRI